MECSFNLQSVTLACVVNFNSVGEDSVSLAASLRDGDKCVLTGKSYFCMQSAKPLLLAEALGS